MLRSIKRIYGDKLGASDGEIGHVKDFYFDDQRWAIRYVVADTGSWIAGRLVLLSPHAFGSLPPDGKILPVNLTRKQIEHSPAIESHQPVSRQYEEEYYEYFGWPYYWQGNELWGLSGLPILSEKSEPVSRDPTPLSRAKQADVHLRSTQSVIGYQIQTSDDIAGHVADFVMEDQRWLICQLVVNTGNRFTGKMVCLLPGQVDRISWEESKVYVNMTKEALLQAPVYDLDRSNLPAVAP